MNDKPKDRTTTWMSIIALILVLMIAFAFGGITYPFPLITYYAAPVFLGFIGWFNITTFISFGEKGRNIYIIFLIVAPLCPIFGIIGILSPNFIVSLVVSIFFFGSFLGLFCYVILGFFIKARRKK